MAGNKEGGIKAAQTTKSRHGDSFYARIGAKGGAKGTTGGFYANKDVARSAGAAGGKKSKRFHKLIEETPTKLIYINNLTGEKVTVEKDLT